MLVFRGCVAANSTESFWLDVRLSDAAESSVPLPGQAPFWPPVFAPAAPSVGVVESAPE